jgi:paraquat-inducible protein B
MSTRASSAAIGAFVVGAIALLLVALLVWGGTGLFHSNLNYVMFFDASVTGLNKGAPVLARGVKIGEVTDVQLRWGTRGVIGVYVRLEPESVRGMAEGGPSQALERAVEQDGLRAQLRLQSFVTGVLYVALDLRPDAPIVLRGLDPKVPELPTIPSDIEVWTAKLERFAGTIEKIPLDRIGQSAAAILDGVRNIVESKDTQDVFRNANAAIGDARTLAGHVDARIDPLVGEIRQTLARLDGGLDAARKLIVDVDGRVDPVATQAQATLAAAQTVLGDTRPLIEDLRRIAVKLDAEADPLLTSLRGTSDAARTTLERAQLTLGSVDQTLEQDSPLGLELFQTLRELRAAALAVRSLADYLERVPDAPVHGIRRPSEASR